MNSNRFSVYGQRRVLLRILRAVLACRIGKNGLTLVEAPETLGSLATAGAWGIFRAVLSTSFAQSQDGAKAQPWR